MTSHPVFIDLSLDEQVMIFNWLKCAERRASKKSEVMLCCVRKQIVNIKILYEIQILGTRAAQVFQETRC